MWRAPTRPRSARPELRGGEVVREGDLLGRPGVVVVPVRPGEAVPAGVLPGGADGEEDARRRAAVQQAAAHLRGDPGQLALGEVAGLALDLEGEGPPEDEVDLLLALVAVDAAALAGAEDELVEAEGRDAEPAAQGDEALRRVRLQASDADPGLHGRRP